MFRSNTCADFYGPCSLSHSRGTRDRGGKKKSVLECRQKWCIKCFRRSRIGAKTDPRAPIRSAFLSGGGRWKYFKSVDNFHESGACNNKYKRRNGNELLRSMINVTQRDIVIARGTGLGTWRRCAPMRSTAEWKNNVGDKVLFASSKRW